MQPTSLETLQIPFYLIRQEVPFTVENAYKKMELHQPIQSNQVQSNETNQTDDTISDIRSRAQNLVDEASRAISDAKIKEKHKQYGIR